LIVRVLAGGRSRPPFRWYRASASPPLLVRDQGKIRLGAHNQRGSLDGFLIGGSTVECHHAVTGAKAGKRHFVSLGHVVFAGRQVQDEGLLGGGYSDGIALIALQGNLIG